MKGLGRQFTVRLVDTLGDLKRLITQQTGVPGFQQRLLLERTPLENGRSLASQGLCPNGTILLVVESCDQPVSILVRNEKGRSQNYEVLLTQKVAELKQKVSVCEKVPTDQFWLGFQGRSLDDKALLGDCGLTASCTVDMNLYLRGGQARDPHPKQ